jgi:hypothetical protein
MHFGEQLEVGVVVVAMPHLDPMLLLDQLEVVVGVVGLIPHQDLVVQLLHLFTLQTFLERSRVLLAAQTKLHLLEVLGVVVVEVV